MLNFISSLRWQDFVDIMIVTIIIYRIILLIRGTRAVQMLIGIVVIIVIYFISRQLDLLTLHWLLKTFLNSIFLIVIIVFQRDIRRVLTQVGKAPFQKQQDVLTQDLNEIVKAATHMARRRTGALIAIERETGLRDYIDSGHSIDAKLTRELLISIFLHESPIHDGAVVVCNGRIHSAGCLLPLTQNPSLSKRYGTRHRAAIGLSEETDAVVIVVSEERQEISLVENGTIKTFRDEESLASALHNIFIQQDIPNSSWRTWLGKANRE
jgi:diadenylate cyclase